MLVSLWSRRAAECQTGTDFRHFSTISITIRVRRTGWNVMKPRIQRVLTHWMPGFSASGGGGAQAGGGSSDGG
jgi:hypothetical protein